jgi:cytochrome c oxidase subunit II
MRRALALVAAALLIAGCADQEWGAFRPRGSAASDLNVLFWVMLALGLAVFVLVVVLFARAARGNPSEADLDPAAPARSEADERRSARLVIGGGIVLPVVVLIPLTIVMLVVGNRLAPRLGEGYEIRVIAHQFWWEIEYPETGMVTANEIHIPAGTPVQLRMETADVIHSVWVPELAGKIDMIPGETTEMEIEADQPGRYLGQCAEFCGAQHARMRFVVVAHPPADFDRWLTDQTGEAGPPGDELAVEGARLFAEVGCAACHRVRGTDADGVLGPDLTRIATRATIAAGTIDNTPAHMAEWILDPQGVKPGNRMPPTPLTDEQVAALVAYMEQLG